MRGGNPTGLHLLDATRSQREVCGGWEPAVRTEGATRPQVCKPRGHLRRPSVLHPSTTIHERRQGLADEAGQGVQPHTLRETHDRVRGPGREQVQGELCVSGVVQTCG